MRKNEIVQAYFPEVPDTTKPISTKSISGLVLLQNIADRLTEMRHDYTAEQSVLESVSMSMDGLTYRMTLKKGYLFHCGADLTAADAVATILSVLKNESSVSQLHLYVDTVSSKSREYAVQSTSRFRFEIKLNRRLSDLLVRLSLPEFSIRHEGGNCYSGLWRVSGRDSTGIVLTLNERHPSNTQSSYKQVRWEKINDPGELPLATSDKPFLYFYPGSQFKSPPDEILIEEQCKDLDYGTSLLLQIQGTSSDTLAARFRSLDHAEKFVAPASLWRRCSLTSLLPRHHVLHHRFNPIRGIDRHLDSKQGRKQIKGLLVVDDGDLDKPLLTRYARFSREQLDIDFTIVNQPPEKLDPVQFLALPIKSFSGLPGDYLTSVSGIKQHFPKTPQSIASDVNKPGAAAFQFCQDVLVNFPLMPIVYSPFVVRTNRTIRKSERTSLFRFADIRGAIDPSIRRNLNDAMLKSLGAAVQMFAHDIKRPFSMMQGMLGMLNATSDPQRIRELSSKFLPNLEQATRYADGLIHDVLEIGSDSEPEPVELHLREIILGTLEEVFGSGAFAGIEFTYDFKHTHLPSADSRKIARVFVNLVANAAEAMKSEGCITFSTKNDPASNLIIVSIGNTGSFVPKEMRDGIFDRFFTSGKARGTGLGLAIVKKIITDHGCSVWCDSDETLGTTFSFTIERSNVAEHQSPLELPKFSAALYRGKISEATPPIKDKTSRTTNKKLKILVVDDDAIYSDMLRAIIDEAGDDLPTIALTTAFNYEQAVESLKNETFDAAVVDVDLGGPDDGLSLVRLIRLDQTDLKICVHSSGPVFELQKRSLESGADAFIPKPMTGALFRAFLGTAEASSTSVDSGTIIVVDDDAFVIEQWEEVKDYAVVGFSSPEQFLEKYKTKQDLPSDLTAIVLDYTFPGQSLTGVDLANRIVEVLGPQSIYLATDRPMKKDEIPLSIKRVVPKNPMQLIKLMESQG